MMKINFFHENTNHAIRKKMELRKWIFKTIELEGGSAGNINFIFCDDDYLSAMNLKYLKHKTLTDILTFPADDENGLIGGDIFISIPRVKENAIIFNQRPDVELQRVMIHGILHLLGYKDSIEAAKKVMKEKENFYLAIGPSALFLHS